MSMAVPFRMFSVCADLLKVTKVSRASAAGISALVFEMQMPL